MKTDYIFHDDAYKKRKVEGRQGWATQEQVDDYLSVLEKVLQTDYAPKRGKLLELGCGDGANSLWLATRGYEVYGVDISPTAIEWAKEKAKECAIEIDFRVGNVLNLQDYSDNLFDFVLDGHCFHCIISEDRKLFLASALRVLKPEGLFHVCTMCGEVTNEEMKKHFDPQSRCIIYGQIASRYIGVPEDILAEIRDVGFQILHFEIRPKKHQDDCDELWVAATKQ
jgi:ubiquinone/menaquinone biosynthesis C-methylase UbiE